MSMAHDTCRVIECLVQYGNESHRNGVFNELKDNLVELSKSKYARFMIKKLMSYCDKDQKDVVIRAFTGRVTKLIKHSVNITLNWFIFDGLKKLFFFKLKFACQVIESIFNEHANFAQRNQMLMEFFDPTFALFNVSIFHLVIDTNFVVILIFFLFFYSKRIKNINV